MSSAPIWRPNPQMLEGEGMVKVESLGARQMDS